MSDLVVIVPSRGRPQAVAEMARAFQETCATYEVDLMFVVDVDDPSSVDYLFAAEKQRNWVGTEVYTQQGGSMVAALNRGAVRALGRDPVAVAFLGDDHRPRSEDWDKAYLDALKAKPGLVYGNDLLQGHRLPTQVAMSASVVRALGHMAPPPLMHLYVDNYWRDLGNAAGCITYLPDVVVEHLHPVAGKAEWDEGYKRVNDRGMYDRDAAAYSQYWMAHGQADVAKVRAAVGQAVAP